MVVIAYANWSLSYIWFLKWIKNNLRAKLSRSNMDGGLAWPPFSMKGGIFSGNDHLIATPCQRGRKHSRGYPGLPGLWEKYWKDRERKIHILLWVRPGHGGRRVSFGKGPLFCYDWTGTEKSKWCPVLSDTAVFLPGRDYAQRSEPDRLWTGYAVDERKTRLSCNHPHRQGTYPLSHLL